MKGKKTIVLLSAIMLITSVNLWAQQQLTVAVSTFEARGGLTADEADAITELFSASLVNDGMVRVVDRSNFDRIIAEMQFQASDWTDTDKVARLGRALNATSIIRGTVMTLGGQIAITTSLLDVNTAQIVSSSILRMQDIGEVFDKMPAFVKDLTNFLITSQNFEIGDTGPGGGIVFFIEGNVRKEVSLFLGTGTLRIASTLASNYNGRGYTDWYLPGIRDLELIYENLHRTGIRNFAVGEGENIYWSSTYDGGSHGRNGVQYIYYLNFSNGSRGADYPNVNNPIFCTLAVRDF
jgi:TolB-like protein